MWETINGSRGIMPTQVYECKTHGEFDIRLSFEDKIPHSKKCPECKSKSKHIISPVGGVKVERGWNEKANEYQRDPYTQAKAQAWNSYNENTERGHKMNKPTEKVIQSVAAGIEKNPTPKDVGEYIREK